MSAQGGRRGFCWRPKLLTPSLMLCVCACVCVCVSNGDILHVCVKWHMSDVAQAHTYDSLVKWGYLKVFL